MIPLDPRLPNELILRDTPLSAYDRELLKRLRELFAQYARESNSKIGSVIEDPAYWMLR